MSRPVDAGGGERSDGPVDFDCPRCGQAVSARRGQGGVEVKCPHCYGRFVVPESIGCGPAAEAQDRPVESTVFSLTCTRCGSVLQADTDLIGRVGKCPTCGAEFEIPFFDRATGNVAEVSIPDDPQHPTPMHLYAAAGERAPRFVKGPDGAKMIECPACRAHSPVAADNCAACGLPFTTDGIGSRSPVGTGGKGPGLAVASLVLGIISLPACFTVIPAILAMALGTMALVRPRRIGEQRWRGMAVAGILLGGLSLGAFVVYVVVVA